MDDKTVQRKLNQLVKIANELGDEATRRYGQTGYLFFESGGSFHIMSDDTDGPQTKRQSFVTFTSGHYCTMSAGAW